MYHDVTPPGRGPSSGFPGGDAERYKLTLDRFESHLDAIYAHAPDAPTTTASMLEAERTASRKRPLLLTFDDGGASAAEWIAEALERRGWKGHFFVTTGYVGRPGFLDAPAIRGLHARGHIVGSHSHSHPLRMAHCPEPRLRDEWRRSVALLSDIVGGPIVTASVPGGDHSDLVARTAMDAGISVLFTSCPTDRVIRLASGRIFGRYAIRSSTTAATAAALAAGDYAPRMNMRAMWTMKQAGKRIGGPLYLRIRGRLLGASPEMQWGDERRALSKDPS
jgi:peptidoglycan/xylan/chitin deacetylase (PgdA/CDA1 family)